MQNRYFDFLIAPRFRGINSHFVVSIRENGNQSYKQYSLPTVEIRDYFFMIAGTNFFD